MRPVIRGGRPTDDQEHDIKFCDYVNARGELIRRMGEYCSYCEMHLDASLAVEHVQPKQPRGVDLVDQERALNWDNFLLACTNCNSTKGDTNINLDEYIWPDRDNTFRALKYSEGGIVSYGIDGEIARKAINTIKLTGIDKTPKDTKASDRRWFNRREAWDIAMRSRNRLANNDNNYFREQIVDTALANGFWSVWMTVFKDDSNMLSRFLQAFPGTCQKCFDAENGYNAVARQGGQC
ncbi:HNH endonuclease [Nitratidesulfovibrio sp. 1201_IL3209]|uniref:HNH endonuclease n=1 Tax=Nitratidesulfovibrio sp. 1201_IL3209 TaxID=3084053 RepID=UPI002FD9CC4F